MSGFYFTNAAFIDDNLEAFSIEDIQAVVQKMRAACESAVEKQISFRDLSPYGASRKYLELQMEEYKQKPLVDTGKIQYMVRPRYEVRICNPSVAEELRREVERMLATGELFPVDTSDDTQLECFAELDTVLEG
ncbi:MAG: hypothetical protein AB7G28_22825 [Pirellulales bacterium]